MVFDTKKLDFKVWIVIAVFAIGVLTIVILKLSEIDKKNLSSVTTDGKVENLSDDIGSIERDLNSTDINNLDQDVLGISTSNFEE